jgi:hypothetical protein
MSSPALSDEELEEKLDWLDQLRKESGVPETLNTEDAVLVHFNVCDEQVSVHTYRRWPLEYFVLGRERRYYLTDVVAFAKKRFEEAAAVRRAPPDRPRKKRIRRAVAQPPAPAERPSATQRKRETEPEPAS